MHTDHLGSLNCFTSESGALEQEMSFDAWGRRRNPTNWSYTGMPTTHIIDRGYTGHEHLDGFGLINMNGRMYDPVTGRFLSPDNQVQAPENTQSYNRYTYCLNNPLKYTDPSGWGEEPKNLPPWETDPNWRPNADYSPAVGADKFISYYLPNGENPNRGPASTIVNDRGVIIEVRNDGDPHVYLASKGWKKGGSISGLAVLGYMDPDVNYQEGGQYKYYGPSSPNWNKDKTYQAEYIRSTKALLKELATSSVIVLYDSYWRSVIKLDHMATLGFFGFLDMYKKTNDLALALMPLPEGKAGQILAGLLKGYAGFDYLFGGNSVSDDYNKYGHEEGVTLTVYRNNNAMGECTTFQISTNYEEKKIGLKSMMGW